MTNPTRLSLATAMLGLIMGGTAARADTAWPTLMVTAHEYRYDAPSHVRAGTVRLVLHNRGQHVHNIEVYKLRPGTDARQFSAVIERAAMTDDTGPLLKLFEVYGGAFAVNPGGTSEVTLRLTPGTYLLTTSELVGQKSAARLGMLRSLQVTPEVRPSPPPSAQYSLRLTDSSIGGPHGVKAGRHVWEVRNDGAELHSAVFLPLLPGKTAKDVMWFFRTHQGNAPVTFPQDLTDARESAMLSHGLSNWVSFSLKPGRYVVVCLLTDPKTHQEHVVMGMVSELTVTPK